MDYSAIKMNKLLIYTTTWVNLKKTLYYMKKSQAQKST